MNTLNSSSPSNHPNSYDIVSFTPPADEVADPAVQMKAGISCGDLPAGFHLEDDGIYEVRPTEAGETFVRICSPIAVRGLYHDPDGRGWGRVVEVQDPSGSLHRHLLDEGRLGERHEAVLRPLRDLGLMVESVDKAAQSVVQLLRTWRPSRRFKRVRSCGWTDDGCVIFVQANGKVIGDEQEVIPSGLAESLGADVQQRGDLKDWREKIAALCIGNSLMTLCVCHALTGPLLRLAGLEGGGFHLSGTTSKGKTTLQKIAASVWGSPSFLQSWRATDNGIEGLAAAYNDTLLALNELAEVDPSKVGDIIYMLGNGQGKARARPDGSLSQSLRWCIALLSSGEVSVEAHMATVGKRIHAGQHVRLIHIAVDRGTCGAFAFLHGMEDSRVFAEHLEAMAGAQYGSAGPAFVRGLIKQRVTKGFVEDLINRLGDETVKELEVPVNGEIRRVLRRYMLAAVAGEIATRFGITGWKRGTATIAARLEFRRWLQDRDAATHAEISNAISKTREFLQVQGHRFLDIGPLSAPDQPGWKAGNNFYIRRDTWARIHKGSDPQEAARLHQTDGLLLTNNGSGLQYKMPRRVIPRELVYAVSGDVLTWKAPRR